MTESLIAHQKHKAIAFIKEICYYVFMDLKNAEKLAKIKKELEEAPADNIEFAELSNEDKMANLGSRFLAITHEVDGRKPTYRTFYHKFQAENGDSIELEMTASYRDSKVVDDKLVPLDTWDLESISANWSAFDLDDHTLAKEEVPHRFGSLTNEDPEDVSRRLNRLDESLTTAESAYSSLMTANSSEA